jgi:hypothetical protein
LPVFDLNPEALMQPEPDARVREILKTANFVADEQRYSVIRLPARAVTAAAGIIAEISEPFLALLVDEYEVTLVIPSDAVADFASRLRSHETTTEVYCLITCDMVLPPDLIGFMAEISAILAKAAVTILPYAAFSRDHLLVPEKQLGQAMQALSSLKAIE